MNHLIETSIPPLYSNWSINQMVGADNLEEINQKITQYLHNPNLEKDGHNLYIYSVENGTGKTSLAYYVLGEMHKPRRKETISMADHIYWDRISNKKISLPESIVDITPVVAVKFANYLKFCVDQFNQDSKDAKKAVMTTPFLLLDDVSTWATTDNLRRDKTELILLMMYRREHLLPTIITSNLIPTEFDKTFGATASSKVLENFSYIEIKGGDVRPIIHPDMFEETDPDIVIKQEIEELKRQDKH